MYKKRYIEQLQKRICYTHKNYSVPENQPTFNKYYHGRKAKNTEKL